MEKPIITQRARSSGDTCSVDCPICGCSSQRIISRFADKQLRRCLGCEVGFVHPLPSPGAMEAGFEDSAAATPNEFESRFERNRERVLSRVAGHIHNRRGEGSILDVGCGTGFFLARFFKNPKWQIYGVELSRSATDEAAERGIRIHLGNTQSAGFMDDSFDVVSVLDAFYYFPKPQFELGEFKRLLKPDGMLIIELPLASSRISRTSTWVGRALSGTKVPLLQSSDHLFYYCPTSIALLLEECGFEVEAILPLPGNEQKGLFRNLIYRIYGFLSLLVHYISFSRFLIAPRFLVVARKDQRRPISAGAARDRSVQTVSQ